MKTAIVCALLAAVPVELFIGGVFSYPVGSGIDPHDPLLHRVTEHLWLELHWPGLLVYQWLTRHGNPGGAEMLAVFLSGYIQIAAALIGMILLARWIRVRMDGRAVTGRIDRQSAGL